MLLIDPKLFLSDPDVKPFARDFRVDLTAADVPTKGSGKFVVAQLPAPQGQVLIVKAIMPHVWVRTNVGFATESFRPMTPQEVNGHFLWDPVANDESLLLRVDYNKPRLASGPLNADRSRLNGITHVSPDPWSDVSKAWDNPLFSFKLDPQRTLEVVWSILPQGIASPQPFPYAVGGGVGTQRVDFAGCIIVGVSCPNQKYEQIAQSLSNPPSGGSMGGGGGSSGGGRSRYAGSSVPTITPGNP